MNTGSIIPFALPFIVAVILIMFASNEALRKLLPCSFNALGSRNIWRGYGAMLIPIGVMASYGANDLSGAINEALVEMIFCYFVAALFGVPMVVLLRRIQMSYVPIIVIGAVIVVLLFSLFTIPLGRFTFEIGLRNWYAMLPQYLIYSVVLSCLFCVGARIPFFIKRMPKTPKNE